MHRYTQPFTIVREGFVFSGCALALAALAFPYGFGFSTPFLVIAGWILFFFRDPTRKPPSIPNAAISAADGLVIAVSQRKAPDPVKSDETFHCISIFMSLFDVHVNRMPLPCSIKNIYHIPGKFVDASEKNADNLNERCIYDCSYNGQRFVVVQVAGRYARRIKPFFNADKKLKLAERFGLICFGSRVDVYLPEDFDIFIQEGQRSIAGETILGQKKTAQKA